MKPKKTAKPVSETAPVQDEAVESTRPTKPAKAPQPMTTYRCNHCEKDIPTVKPTPDLVSSKGYWDSATECEECGKMNFVKVYPNGETSSQKM